MSDVSDTPKSSPNRFRRNLIVIVVVSVVLGAVNFVYFNYFQTYHLVVVDEGKLYRDGNRSLREFRNAVRRAKPKTVVAIIDQQEYNEPEFVQGREYAQANGIAYVWIPIKAGKYPTPEQVKQFLAVASDPTQQPVLYHDDEGIRRAGMMMAAYQETVLGYDDAKAKASIQAFGHSDRTIDDVRRFIDAYDPKVGLTTDLNPSTTNPTAGE